MDGGPAGGEKTAGFVTRLKGWFRRLSEADKQLGGIPPVCCGAHIDYRRLCRRPAKRAGGRDS